MNAEAKVSKRESGETQFALNVSEIDSVLAQFCEADARQWDLESEIPRTVIESLAASSLLGTTMPKEFGGRDWCARSLGHLFMRLGSISLSLVSIMTVHSMVLEALRLWGTAEQKKYWMPKLISGEVLGAFGLTEPTHGSDAMNVQSRLTKIDSGYSLSGSKKWISFGQGADVLLVFGQTEHGETIACLVPTKARGFTVKPMKNLLGFRGAMLGDITLKECFVPDENIIGRAGGGVPYVAGGALDLGRLAIAYGCLGAMEACTQDSVIHARSRTQFDEPLANHQLVQQLLSNMITSVKVARQLCDYAARLRDEGSPHATLETTVAKYIASTHSVKVASDAVQVFGAAGCSADESRVERYYRDTRITEIIEGSNQMQQMMIARNGMSEFQRQARVTRKLQEAVK